MAQRNDALCALLRLSLMVVEGRRRGRAGGNERRDLVRTAKKCEKSVCRRVRPERSLRKNLSSPRCWASLCGNLGGICDGPAILSTKRDNRRATAVSFLLSLLDLLFTSSFLHPAQSTPPFSPPPLPRRPHRLSPPPADHVLFFAV